MQQLCAFSEPICAGQEEITKVLAEAMVLSSTLLSWTIISKSHDV